MSNPSPHKTRLGYTTKTPHDLKRVSWIRRRRGKVQIGEKSPFTNDDVGRGSFYNTVESVFRPKKKEEQ